MLQNQRGFLAVEGLSIDLIRPSLGTHPKLPPLRIDGLIQTQTGDRTPYYHQPQKTVAGKSIQSQERTEGCLTRPEGKAVVNNCGTRWVHRTLCRALEPAKENNYAPESPNRDIVWGY